ncbi:hypothetical protein PP713_17930 [Mycobacterium sp. CSUR Q5927]|nr:hypothetical protein [Mycobacterium sp. CSUR Q5927]
MSEEIIDDWDTFYSYVQQEIVARSSTSRTPSCWAATALAAT